MLVLTRKVGEQLIVGDGIVIEVLETQGARVSIGVAAPRSVNVRRGELPPLTGAQAGSAAAAVPCAEGRAAAAPV